ncbi:hypothetical protein AX15_002908 [Amanita polypyramis BW_CC]|nr:hypothetical protein AX15_002908 [Amanita polypyramis BW_CC]
MIISEKHPQSLRSSPVHARLTSRPLDLIYFCFFLIHIPATLLLDIQHLYPVWLVPPFIQALPRYYLQMSNDPLVGGVSGFLGINTEHLIWFKCFIALEVLFQLPVFFLGARGLYTNSRSIYVLLLAYGASTATTTLPCVAAILQTPETTAATIAQKIVSVTFEQRLLLLSGYIPFLLIPLMMAVDMAFRLNKVVGAGVRAMELDKMK